MASTTGLLKTQQSRQKTIWNAEDQVIDDVWRYSAQTADDFQAYMQHYQARLNNPQIDGGSARTYTNKLMTANKAFTSNEIQRASIDIIEGRQPEAYKVKVLEDLYTQAYQNGDLNLAQNLRLQLDNQYVKMQNAATAASGAASAANSQSLSDLNAQLSDIANGQLPFSDLKGLTASDLTNVLNEGGIANALDVLTKAAGGPDGLQAIFGDANVNPLQALSAMTTTMYQSAMQAAQAITDPTTREKAMSAVNAKIASDKFSIGGKSFSLSELQKESDNISQGNPSIRFVSGPNGLVAQGRPAVDYVFQYDANGNPMQAHPQAIYGDATTGGSQFGYPAGTQVYYKASANGGVEVIPYDQVYDKNGNLQSKYKTQNPDPAKRSFLTQEDVLAAAGFKLDKNTGTYIVASPGLRQQLADKGIAESAISKDSVVVDASGHVRFKTADGQLFQAVTDSFENGGSSTHIYDVKAQSAADFLGGKLPRPETSTVLGQQHLRDLQSNVGGGTLQGGGGNIVQPAGGTTQVLQQAASLQQLQQLQAQRLQVQAQQAPSISVQPYSAPTPIKVATTIYQPQLKVTQPVAQPLTVQPAPQLSLSGSLQGGSGRLQGSLGSLQGGTGYLQGGSLRVQ